MELYRSAYTNIGGTIDPPTPHGISLILVLGVAVAVAVVQDGAWV